MPDAMEDLEVLPPELLLIIGEELLRLNAKKTLMTLLCASRRTYELCIPMLMRTVVVSLHSGFSERRIVAFAMDSLNVGKLAHIKSLTVDDNFLKWNASSAVTMLNGVANLEKLVCGSYTLVPFLFAFMQKRPAFPLLRTLELDSLSCTFLSALVTDDMTLELPMALTDVALSLCGTKGQCRRLLSAVDRLPKLDRLTLYLTDRRLGPGAWNGVFEFPKLMRCLKIAEVCLPEQADLLTAETALEELLVVTLNNGVDDMSTLLWTALRQKPSLTKLHLVGCPTSLLVGLPSVPQIRELKLEHTKWNLDETWKALIVALRNVELTFCNNSVKNEAEIEFWKSLPFVRYLS
jgi:hypothetical protein